MGPQARSRLERRVHALRRGLRGARGRGAAVLVLLLLVPLGLTLVLRSVPALDPMFESPRFHIVVVSAIALCALVVALLTSLSAARAKRPAAVLLAVGCVAVGLLMFAHGMTTPGIGGRGFSFWVVRFPVLALAAFALCLATAAGREDGLPKRLAGRFPIAGIALATGLLALGSLYLVARPHALAGTRPIPGEQLITWIVLGGTIVTLLGTGAVHWHRWRLGRDRVQLGLMAAAWLSANAAVALEIGHLWRVSWWDYHVYLLAGFAAAAWAVVTESRRARSIRGALASVSINDPIEHISRGHPEAMDALVGAVEAKDRHMRGHSSRVAEIALRVGLRLDLGPDELRGLAQGAFLHDIGKIGVPDEVLNKRGRLTREDWSWIEQHPIIGGEMAGRAPSLHDSLAVIRHHHERWDGSGYPDRLAGEDIPIAARIATIADVWDALTSDRSYRPAWPMDRALAHIGGAAGRLFDPLTVEAFFDVLLDQGLWPERTRPDLETLTAMAEACHPRSNGHAAGASAATPRRSA